MPDNPGDAENIFPDLDQRSDLDLIRNYHYFPPDRRPATAPVLILSLKFEDRTRAS